MTATRQVTFPKRVTERLHLKPGDCLGVEETENGLLIRPQRFDRSRLAPLSHLISQKPPEPYYEATRR